MLFFFFCFFFQAEDGIRDYDVTGVQTCALPILQVAVEEAVGSLRDLRSHVGGVAPVLAYPGGAFNDEVVQHLRDHFELAFTTCRGINDMGQADALRLRRINVSRHTPNSLVRAQMLGGIRHLSHRWPLESAM